MDQPVEKPTQAALSRLLVRGESLIGSIGLATAAILLAVIGLTGWWSMRAEQDAWRVTKNEQIRVLTQVLTQSAESMLIDNDLSALRRMLMESKRQHELERALRTGGHVPLRFRTVALFTVGGVALAAMTLVLVIAQT